jgi:hypothetical protein
MSSLEVTVRRRFAGTTDVVAIAAADLRSEIEARKVLGFDFRERERERERIKKGFVFVL